MRTQNVGIGSGRGLWRSYWSEVVLSELVRRQIWRSAKRGIMAFCLMAVTMWGVAWCRNEQPMDWSPVLVSAGVAFLWWLWQFATLVADGYTELLQEFGGGQDGNDLSAED